MSTGQTPGEPPAPVVVQKTIADRLWDLLPLVAVFLLAVAVNRGWVTPQQADVIKQTIPLKSAEPETVTVTTSLKESEAEPRGVTSEEIDKFLPIAQRIIELINARIIPKVIPDTPTPVTPITPTPITPVDPSPSEIALRDQVKALQDQVKSLLDAIARLTAPPKPIEVTPKPVPAPVDIGPKILITDESGKPITATTIEAGILFQVTSSVKPESAGWSVSRNGQVSAVELGSGYVCSLQPGAWVEFHLADFTTRQKSVARITCNQGPQPPPPNPVPTPIEPTTDTTPKPKSGDLRVVIIWEKEKNYSENQLQILNSVALLALLDSKCVLASDGRRDWRKWEQNTEVDPTSTMGALFAAALPEAKRVGLPAIVVSCGAEARVSAIPANAKLAEIESLIVCK